MLHLHGQHANCCKQAYVKAHNCSKRAEHQKRGGQVKKCHLMEETHSV